MNRFLLADDDTDLRAGIAELLSALRLEILHAETGLEALEIVRGGRIHAALLDWNMPACSGLEALAQIQGIQRGLPCILYSGNLTPDMEGIALRAGAFAVMRKPVVPELLRSEVQRALEAHRRGDDSLN